MANLVCKADGNWTDAATWGQEATGAGATQLTKTGFTDSSASYVYCTAFTVTNAEVIEGVLLYIHLQSLLGTSFEVALSDDNGVTATRSISVNIADLASAIIQPGWIFFKFSSTLTADGGSDYRIGIKHTGASSSVRVFRDGTAGNWTRILRKSTTAALAAADTPYIVGELTGAGTGNDLTVTMNQTASTDYGEINVGKRGILNWGTAASTAYLLKWSGDMNIWNDGKVQVGTVATPIPSTSTAELSIDNVSNVDWGILVKAGGTFIVQGAAKTNVQTLLSADAASGQAICTVVTTAGLVTGEEVGIAPTGRTINESERKTITVDSGTQFTCSTNLSFAHSGTNTGGKDTRAEVIFLTRNVKIHGASVTLCTYMSFAATAIIDIDYLEYYNFGSATAGKRGINILTTTGSCNINGMSIHDPFSVSSFAFFIEATLLASTITNCVNYGSGFTTISAGATGWTIDNCTCLSANVNAVSFQSISVTGTLTNCRGSGSTSTGGVFYIGASNSVIGTFSNLVGHTSARAMVIDGVGITGTITNLSGWRCTGAGLEFLRCNEMTFDTFTLFGNTTNNISISAQAQTGQLTLLNGTINSEATFTTTNGINVGVPLLFCTIENTTFGATVAHTNDINLSGTNLTACWNLRNCLMTGVEVLGQSNLTESSFISSQNHDQTAGNHKTWKKYGTLASDIVIFDASPSLRITPNDAVNTISSKKPFDRGIFKVAVPSGGTVVVGAKVRESVAGDGTDYNGNRLKLILRKNVAAGIAADIVIATATVASEGAFEAIGGVTPSVSDDAILQFDVRGDGTTGWFNVDTFSAV